jgi:hypothetical protein
VRYHPLLYTHGSQKRANKERGSRWGSESRYVSVFDNPLVEHVVCLSGILLEFSSFWKRTGIGGASLEQVSHNFAQVLAQVRHPSFTHSKNTSLAVTAQVGT